MQPTRLTQADIATCNNDTLAAALRAGARGSNLRTGAVEALADYNGGDLLTFRPIRDFITVDDDGRAHVRWARLHAALIADEGEIGHLVSSTARYAALLACALATGTPMPELDRAVGDWGNYNAKAMARAFALACRQPDPRDQAKIAQRRAATISRAEDLAQALAADGDRLLTARAAGALVASVLGGQHITELPELPAAPSPFELLDWVPASREETERALAAVAAIADARARLGADEQAIVDRFGYSGRWERFAAAVEAHAKSAVEPVDAASPALAEEVLAALLAAGTDGLDGYGVAEALHHDVPASVLNACLVRLARPGGDVVYANRRYYLRRNAPAGAAGLAALDAVGVLALDALDVAGSDGATTADLVAAIRETSDLNPTLAEVTAALGLLAARDDAVRQPEPHGRIYATKHLTPASTATTTTGPATPFEQPPTLTRDELETLVRGNLTAAGRDGLTLPAILTAVTAAQGGRMASSGVVLAAIDRVGAHAIDGPPGSVEVRWTL